MHFPRVNTQKRLIQLLFDEDWVESHYDLGRLGKILCSCDYFVTKVYKGRDRADIRVAARVSTPCFVNSCKVCGELRKNG